MKPICAPSLLIAAALAAPAASQCLHDKVVASDGDVSDALGSSVSVSGDWLVAGAPTDEGTVTWSGSAYVYGRDGFAWKETAKLNASDAANSDGFGRTVFVRGGSLLVGAPGKSGGIGGGTGRVYLFEEQGGVWTEQPFPLPIDVHSGMRFGSALGATSAVDRVAVGAENADAAIVDSGAVYVFGKLGPQWFQEAKLTASDGAFLDEFGSALDLDGSRLVVGARSNDETGIGNTTGAAYVYEKSGIWSEVKRLFPADLAGGDYFGAAVAVEGDWILVGAPYDDVPGAFNRGSVYVFQRQAGVWTQTQKLEPAGVFGGSLFGSAIDVSGGVAAITAPNYTQPLFLYERVGNTWQLLSSEPEPDDDDDFGEAVAIDGDMVAVGSPFEDDRGSNSGGVYVFSQSGSTCPPLRALPVAIDLTFGGTQSMALDAGAPNAGQFYLVLGSQSGTSPGIPTSGGVLPLVYDPYMLYLLQVPNPPFLQGSFGLLDGQGRASIALSVPGGTSASPGLIGAPFHHAFAVLSVFNGEVLFASNAEPLSLFP